MSNPYTTVTVSNDYNANPPSDDGAEVDSNEITWDKHKTKIGDPLKTAIESINTGTLAAFGKVAGGVSAKNDNYTVTAGDQGTLITLTGSAAKTFTLLAAATAGEPFQIGVANASTATLTIDGNGSETIDGDTTITIPPRGGCILECDGSNWYSRGRNWSTGTHSYYFPAGAMVPATTNGAAWGQVEETTNKHNYVTLDFDPSTIEYACFEYVAPADWDGGTITYRPAFSSTAADTDTAVWALQGVAVSDGEDSDVAYGTAVEVSDAAQSNAGDYLRAAESGAVTIAGTPAAGDMLQFRIYRNATDGSDTMGEDAQLRGIEMFFTTNKLDES